MPENILNECTSPDISISRKMKLEMELSALGEGVQKRPMNYNEEHLPLAGKI